MRLGVGVLAIALAGCVDSSTGTGSDTGGNGAASTDPTGSWNATQYTLTSVADANTKADYPSLGQAVSVVFTTDHATVTIQQTIGAAMVISQEMSTVGNNMTWGKTPVQATGTFNRGGNSMTLDLSGPAITYDFNHDGTQDLASLHAVLVTH